MGRIIVTGIAGRMGRMIALAVQNNTLLSLAGATELAGHPCVGRDLGEWLGGESNGVKISSALSSIVAAADIVIDFTIPQASIEHLRIVRDAGKKIVIGTTGFSADQKNEIKKAGEAIAIVMAPNMSIGVNTIFNMLGDLARQLGDDFDVEIVEAHHRYKKDSPSGTAIRMAEIIAEATGKDLAKRGCYGRKGMVGERPRGEIAVHAVRSGDIVGEHTVSFGAIGERIEIVHKAHNRETFAKGAVRAAEFLLAQDQGLYSMQDVLK